MNALETMTALRICSNHPSMIDKGCEECPYEKACASDEYGSSPLMQLAADVIEQLMKELAAARAGVKIDLEGDGA